MSFAGAAAPFALLPSSAHGERQGACKHGSGESYVRKHWFEVETTTGRKAVLYFERQPRGRNKTARWWLYSIDKEKRETRHAVRAESPSEDPNRDP